MVDFLSDHTPDNSIRWPAEPRKGNFPVSYSEEDLYSIPTGSLYFATRNNPYSALSHYLTGCSYDFVGIILHSELRDDRYENKRETYVFGVETFYGDSPTPSLTKLSDLVNDPRTQDHAILPLRTFYTCQEEFPRRFPEVSKTSPKNPSKASSDPLYENSKKDFRHNHEKCRQRRRSLEKKRNELLGEILSSYVGVKKERVFDRGNSYQMLASIFSLPLSESRGLTSPELIASVLWRLGFLEADSEISPLEGKRGEILFLDPRSSEKFFDLFPEKEDGICSVVSAGEKNGYCRKICSQGCEIVVSANTPSERKKISSREYPPFNSVRIVDFLEGCRNSLESSPARTIDRSDLGTAIQGRIREIKNILQGYISPLNFFSMRWFHDCLIPLEIKRDYPLRGLRKFRKIDLMHLMEMLDKFKLFLTTKLSLDDLGTTGIFVGRICLEYGEILTKAYKEILRRGWEIKQGERDLNANKCLKISFRCLQGPSRVACSMPYELFGTKWKIIPKSNVSDGNSFELYAKALRRLYNETPTFLYLRDIIKYAWKEIRSCEETRPFQNALREQSVVGSLPLIFDNEAVNAGKEIFHSLRYHMMKNS